MSKIRKARLTSTKASSHRRWSRSHLLLLGMGPPHLLGQGLNLDRMLEHRIGPVPLCEVLAAHERPVLRGPPVIVPQVEVHEVDGLLERLGRQDVVLTQSGD